MELLFVTIIAAGFGLAVRYIFKGHSTYGVLLLPAVAVAVTATVWVGLLWLGWTFDGTWIWVASLAAGTIVPIIITLSLPKMREARDAAMLQRLARA